MISSQVVFLPIGDGKCGDSIAIRFGDLQSGDPAKQYVIVIDGGYTNDWQKVVDLVLNRFRLSKIDLLISTHLDGDHIGGLPGVVENLKVDNLWMHLPWEHSGDYLDSRQDEFKGRGYTKDMEDTLSASSDLALAAERAGITPEEPFTGKQFITPYGFLTVLGPSKQYYEKLLPEIVDKSLGSSQSTPPGIASYYSSSITHSLQSAIGKIENHFIETLTDRGETSASNDSSAIIIFELTDGPTSLRRYLFTGDAGIQALSYAAEYFQLLGYTAGDLNLIQVPHHGSRKNVGPTILDKFLGPRTALPGMTRGEACVSVGKNCQSDGHPYKVVTNALKRRGYNVFQTQGTGIKFGEYLEGFSSPAVPLPLYDTVEDDD